MDPIFTTRPKNTAISQPVRLTGNTTGVATRHLARKGAEVCSCIGAGPVSKACFEAIALEAKEMGLGQELKLWDEPYL